MAEPNFLLESEKVTTRLGALLSVSLDWGVLLKEHFIQLVFQGHRVAIVHDGVYFELLTSLGALDALIEWLEMDVVDFGCDVADLARGTDVAIWAVEGAVFLGYEIVVTDVAWHGLSRVHVSMYVC